VTTGGEVGGGRSIRAIRILVAVVALVIIGCDSSDPEPVLGPAVPVAVYARIAPPTLVWVAVSPLTDPPLEVGFNGADLGVACWSAPTGSQVVVLDGDPGKGSTHIVRAVGPVPAGPAPAGGRALWLDVAADGSMTTGAGVPGWWVSGGGAC
jgi:hypothetical protein